MYVYIYIYYIYRYLHDTIKIKKWTLTKHKDLKRVSINNFFIKKRSSKTPNGLNKDKNMDFCCNISR